ncbi:type I restriction-modification system subunit M [Paraferrimonas haliotis]|uniref:site-specific DNA-methyltransferase (adenine-specific) n=1 Tax=Paraferrimonas haliotis TaxID=2013866 RepID=A0AA37TPQ1_9GAMM|nr:class I SAM-dependent DNA methyltransferase [Paraferrimonas haliotis]GLS84688.1 DNA methyltransferase [Paraferrimonas haliotis]
MAKQPTKKTETKSFEQSLWDTATALRGNLEPSEYKYPVLALIFLKYVGDAFTIQRDKLIADGHGSVAEQPFAYTKDNVFYLPEESRWSYLQQHSKQEDISLKIDTALALIEKSNEALRGALPDNLFSRLQIENASLSALIDAVNNIDTTSSEDVIGRVYEYFLANFAANEGKKGGEFYTPNSIVNLIAEMIEPYSGKIYDPCCGSGGMFVQSLKFIENHQGNKKDISVYGQEFTATTFKLAKMNLAIRGISANLGEAPRDTLKNDQHLDLKADYIMANPPFNIDKWRGEDELLDDARWAGYEVPPVGNANYAWLLHMISKLSVNGTAGIVLANGSMSTSTKGELAIRKQILENDLVDCIVNLPSQLFYGTQIPACIWFLSKNKKRKADNTGKTLFIDAREIGYMKGRVLRDFTAEDIAKVAQTYHNWRDGENYEDIAGFCKSSELEEIKKHDYVLTPGRYVGAAEEEDDGIPFEEKMADLTAKLGEQFAQSAKLENDIKANLKGLGYEF